MKEENQNEENQTEEVQTEEIQAEKVNTEETQNEEAQVEEAQNDETAPDEDDAPRETDSTTSETEESATLVLEEPFVDKSVYETEKSHSKLKKVKKVFAIIGASIGGVIVLSYLAISIWFMFHFNNNTYIDGENVSFKSTASVNDTISSQLDDYSLTVKLRNDEEVTINGYDIGLIFKKVVSIKEIKAKQNGFLWFLYIGDKRKNYETEYAVTYDEELFNGFIENLDFLQEDNMIEPENAYVIVENGEGVVIEETAGTLIDIDNFKQTISLALSNMETYIDISDTDCYQVADITADSEDIDEILNELQKYLDMEITYEIDEISWTLDADTFGEWLYYKNEAWHFDFFSVKAYVEELAETYDTVGTVRNFRTYEGKLIQQEGETYGWAIDVAAESARLNETLAKGRSVTRTPEFSQTGAAYNNFNDIGDTYVEVDLSNQCVYLIVEGELILETDCVSGCIKNGNGTPEGLYSIKYKKSPAVLKGEDYESHVTYWMPFNGGIGLHDATWRSKFGGDIYYSNGSHGCINLPKSSAETIYSYVSTGTPVICYY